MHGAPCIRFRDARGIGQGRTLTAHKKTKLTRIYTLQGKNGAERFGAAFKLPVGNARAVAAGLGVQTCTRAAAAGPRPPHHYVT